MQVPRLPDWAIIDIRTPPDPHQPGKIEAADFFGERWELSPAAKREKNKTASKESPGSKRFIAQFDGDSKRDAK
jgi:hypothetical protein